MRQAQQKKKKNLVPNSVHTRPGQEDSKQNSKKIIKLNSGFISIKKGLREAEKEKKILVPNSVHTRPGQENSEKNSKKIIKPLPSIIFCQNLMRQAEKARKKFQSRIPFVLDPGKKIPKKIAKKFKTTKNLFPALFIAKTG